MADRKMKFKVCGGCRWFYRDILTGRVAADIACEFCRRRSNFEPLRTGDADRIKAADDE